MDLTVKRPYTSEQVRRLRGSFKEEYRYSRYIAERLWNLLQNYTYIHALGCLTGGQAVQCAKARLPAIYCSGWQVAADANGSDQTYPDQSLYTSNSVPTLVRKINNALKRADQIEWSEDNANPINYFLPIIADAEAGFGGPLNAFELMKQMIEAGVAGVHFEDQLSSAKKCGHMGGKVLIPGSQFIQTLIAARLASDVMDIPTLIIARTDANSAKLLTNAVDEQDDRFLLVDGHYKDGICRTQEGFCMISGGLDMAINRGLQYAPYADLLWCETSTPDLAEAKKFAEAIHEKFPGKLLAYNCSPSFNWKKKLDDATIAKFQRELGAMGYRFQFVTLAGFHSLNHSMFELARDYQARDMTAYAELQEKEFASQKDGFTAVKHQREVGTSYFDLVAETIGQVSTIANRDSTEKEQF